MHTIQSSHKLHDLFTMQCVDSTHNAFSPPAHMGPWIVSHELFYTAQYASGSAWWGRPPDMESSFEYTEIAVADSRPGMCHQFEGGRELTAPIHKETLMSYTGP
jgi:hypothetical protein